MMKIEGGLDSTSGLLLVDVNLAARDPAYFYILSSFQLATMS